MRRQLRRIGLQPSAPTPPAEPAEDAYVTGVCRTCVYNQKASYYSTPPHELIVHCSAPGGIGYTVERADCGLWAGRTVPRPPSLCRDCVHQRGSSIVRRPQGDDEGIHCAVYTVQRVAYAAVCRQYRNEEMQEHLRREAEEEAAHAPPPEPEPTSRYQRVLYWARMLWRGHA